jgi:hypothetical protein
MHNTIESQSRIIKKPDWSYEVAKSVKRYLVQGCARLSVVEATSLTEALEQLLVTGYKICPPTFIMGNLYMPLDHVIKIQNVMADAVETPWVFGTSWGVPMHQWLKLLSLGVVVKTFLPMDVWFEGDNIESPAFKSAPLDLSQVLDYSKITNSLQFVGTAMSACELRCLAAKDTCDVSTFLQVTSILMYPHLADSDASSPLQGNVSVLMPLCESVSPTDVQKLHEALLQPTKARYFIAKSDKFARFLPNFGQSLVLFGSFQEILTGLSRVPDDMVADVRDIYHHGETSKYGALQVSGFNASMLLKMIQASRKCTLEPATLGFVRQSRDLYAIKTLADLRFMVAALVQEDHIREDVVASRVALVELQKPKSIF